MAAPRLRRVSTKREMENLLDDYVTQGYEIVSQGESSTLVRKATWGSAGGHVLWALLTAWFSLGLGNLGGDPFFDTLDSPLNNDPPSVRFQELYRAKQRHETVAVNRQFGLPDDFMTGKSASPSASDIPGINDQNIAL